MAARNGPGIRCYPVVSEYVLYRVRQGNPHWQGPPDEDTIDGPASLDNSTPLDPAFDDTIRKLTKEFEEKYQQVFNEVCGQIFVTPDSAHTQFLVAVRTLFAEDINWGRVIALLAFSGSLASQCVQKEMPGMVDLIVLWTTQYIDQHIASWIVEHGGWNGLVEFYRNGSAGRNGSSWPTFLCQAFGTIGMLTIGALLAQK